MGGFGSAFRLGYKYAEKVQKAIFGAYLYRIYQYYSMPLSLKESIGKIISKKNERENSVIRNF